MTTVWDGRYKGVELKNSANWRTKLQGFGRNDLTQNKETKQWEMITIRDPRFSTFLSWLWSLVCQLRQHTGTHLFLKIFRSRDVCILRHQGGGGKNRAGGVWRGVSSPRLDDLERPERYLRWSQRQPGKHRHVFYQLWYRNLFIGSDHWLPLSLTHSLTPCCLVDLVDVSLACENANSKLVGMLMDYLH